MGADVAARRLFQRQVHPDDRPGFLRAMDGDIGEGGETRTLRLRTADGGHVWFRDTLHRGAGAGGLVGCMTDITRLKAGLICATDPVIGTGEQPPP